VPKILGNKSFYLKEFRLFFVKFRVLVVIY
jgi:hypothetical protein